MLHVLKGLTRTPQVEEEVGDDLFTFRVGLNSNLNSADVKISPVVVVAWGKLNKLYLFRLPKNGNKYEKTA